MRLTTVTLCFLAALAACGPSFAQAVPDQDRISLSEHHSLLFMRPFEPARCGALRAADVDNVRLGDALESVPGWRGARNVCVPDKTPGVLLCEYGLERGGQIFVYHVYEAVDGERSPIVLLAYATKINNTTTHHDDIVAHFENKYGAFSYAIARKDSRSFEYVVAPQRNCDVEYNISLSIGHAPTHFEVILKIYDKGYLDARATGQDPRP